MIDSIWKIIAKIADLFDKSYDPKKARNFILIIIITLLIGGSVYSYFSFDFRIARRIENIEKLSKVDIDIIKSNHLLYSEYESILNDINNRSFWEKIDLSQIRIIDNKKDTKILKFFTGGFLWFIFMALSPFIYKSVKEALGGVIVFLIIGIIMGWIGRAIPTFIYPMINYIGFPAIQLTLFLFLLFRKKK